MIKVNFLITLLIIIINANAIGEEVIFRQLNKGEVRSVHEAKSKKFMIATQGKNSTNAGSKMYQLGGNIIDAFTAISFVISVERPQSTGLGGGGFALYLPSKSLKPTSFDFREIAPIRSTSKMYLDKNGNEIKFKSRNGVFSVGIPGLVAGVLKMHKKYGKLPLSQVLKPAIELARKGLIVNPELNYAMKVRKKILYKYPSSRKIFLKQDGSVYKIGEKLFQKDLANTIELISKDGASIFYNGIISKQIYEQSKALGGIITLEDFKKYKVLERPAVQGKFKSYDVFSMGPPSSGGVHILEILNMIENYPIKKWGIQNEKTIHVIAMSMQQAFADRAKFLGDPDFVNVPIKTLTSKSYARKMSKKFSLERYRTAKKVYPGQINIKEHDHTTHFTIADNTGAVISSTQTINGYFGSGVVAEGTGIVLNNEMDDFATKVGASNLFGAIGGKNNLIKPFKRPLSSMSPTIVLKNNKPILALGSPSGTRILTCVAQSIINYIVFGLDLYKSISLTRFHHQWMPDYLRVEESGFNSKTTKALLKMGYKIKYNNLGCKVQAIAFESQMLHGVSDIRGAGFAFGK